MKMKRSQRMHRNGTVVLSGTLQRLLCLFIVLFIATGTYAQSVLTGKVTDAAHEPLIGATIAIEGLENKGTITDIDGNYKLSLPAGTKQAVIKFQYVGFITRPIRWDSDHVVLFDDETKEICKEIVRCGGLDGRVNIALDYFDASINRISAWTVGFRNVEKALLSALCTPHTVLKELQDTNQFTELMVRQEELKTLPFGEVWDEYCRRNGVPVDGAWFEEVKKYEQNVLSKRI